MHITTRLATAADSPLIYSLYQEAMRGYIEKIWGWDDAWQKDDFAKSLASGVSCVIENDFQFSGYFQLELGEESDYLRMLIISPTLRSLGIGRRLLANIVETSHDSGRKMRLRVFRINTEAQRFYATNGWRVIDEEEVFLLMENASRPLASRPDRAFQRTAESYAFVVR